MIVFGNFCRKDHADPEFTATLPDRAPIASLLTVREESDPQCSRHKPSNCSLATPEHIDTVLLESSLERDHQRRGMQQFAPLVGEDFAEVRSEVIRPFVVEGERRIVGCRLVKRESVPVIHVECFLVFRGGFEVVSVEGLGKLITSQTLLNVGHDARRQRLRIPV